MADQTYLITGRVVRTNSQDGMEGLRVDAWDNDLLIDDLVGSAVTDEDGAFQITVDAASFRELFFDRHMDLYFRVYRGATLIALTKDRTIWNVASASTAVVIEIDPDAALLDGDPRRVSGHVYLPLGQPAQLLGLRLYSRGLGDTLTRLASTQTDGGGAYSMRYLLDATRDIELYAVDAEDRDVALTRTIFDPGEHLVLDVACPAELKALEPEFDRLTPALRPHLGDRWLSDLVEDAEHHDLTLLSRVSGWDARLVAIAWVASSLEADPVVRVEEKFLYGLMRSGLPQDKRLLAQVMTDVAEESLRRATDAGIVALTEREWAAFRAEFDAFARRVALTITAPGSEATYEQLLDATNLGAEAKALFTEVFRQYDGDPDELWASARAQGLSEDDIATLQLQGKLSFLTGNSLPLVQHLMGLPIRNLAELVGRDLHGPDRWREEMELAGHGLPEGVGDVVPASYVGALADRVAAYARDLANRVRVAFPADTLARTIEVDEDDSFGLGHRPPVVPLLKDAAMQGYRPGQTPVGAFLSSHPDVTGDLGAESLDRARRELMRLHRIYQVTPSDQALQAVMKEGFSTASGIANAPRDAFVRSLSETLDEAQATLVHQRAQQVTATTLAVVTEAQKLGADSAPYVMQAATETPLPGAVFPTMETLFGSQDYCECEHCRSVLSPAAYFVDLLHFLDPDAEDWAFFLTDWEKKHGTTYPHPKPFDVLTERRPDLPHLALTCENTNTEQPYIDLVNEILEFDVAHHNHLTRNAVGDTGTSTSEELLTEPAHVENHAYELLADAVYPLVLPFDLWTETARRFSASLGVPLWHLVELFGTPEETALERLGCTAEQTGIFRRSPKHPWYELYGHKTSADALAALRTARDVAQALGASYVELTELVSSGFVNPGLADLQVVQKLGLPWREVIDHFTGHAGVDGTALDAMLHKLGNRLKFGPDLVQWLQDRFEAGAFDRVVVLRSSQPNSCDFDETYLRFAGGGDVDADTLTRINLLMRLVRLQGWSISAVDRVLRSLTAPRGTDDAPSQAGLDIGVYAQAVALAERLGLEEAEVASLVTLWADIPTTGPDVLYDDLFLKPSALTYDKTFDSAVGRYLEHLGTDGKFRPFSWPPPRTIPREEPEVGGYVRLGDHVSALQAGLGLTADEITLVIDAVAAEGHQEAPLTMANVSTLYRYRLLASLLDISVADLVALMEIAGIPPFTALPAGWDATAARSRLDAVARVVGAVESLRAAGVTIATLRYLLRHVGEPEGDAPPSEAEIDDLVSALAEQLQAIKMAHPMPGRGPLGEDWFRKELGLVLEPLVVEKLWGLLSRQVRGGERKFFDEQLVGGTETKGALQKSDFATIFPVTGSGDAQPTDEQVAVRDKRLAEAFVPHIQRTLMVAHLSQVLGVATGADPEVLEAVLTKRLIAPDPTSAGKPLLAAFLALGVRGSTQELTDRAHDAYLRLAKVLRLCRALELEVREVRHFAGLARSGEPWSLGTLPVAAADAHEPDERFGDLLQLCRYVGLRRDLSPGTADLLEVLGAGDITGTDAPLAHLTRRDATTVSETRAQLPTADPRTVPGLELLWIALQVVERLGCDAETLRTWSSIAGADGVEARRATATELVKTLKTRIDADRWHELARPVNDELRRLKRDALVAYVLHQHHFEGVEQLFEHYLIDPGMEPVVRTSRIRMAIATVQLFVQRCLLNLEQDVPPSVIRSDYWEWMKRYRVWEANRKIFLYPENWLEPEFRQDKTPLFGELEGALLQEDVTDDKVEDAFLSYLNGLEGIARLRAVATHLETGTSKDDQVLHVVASTYTLPRKHYYRRFASHVWSPWEPIPVDIEGEHVAPVIWRDRLFVFWVTFLLQPKEGQRDFIEPAKGITIPAAERSVDLQLHWTQFVHGRWSPHQAGEYMRVMHGDSEVNAPLYVLRDFDPNAAPVHVDVAYDGGEERGVYVSVGGVVDQTLYLEGRTSPVQRYRFSARSAPPRNPYSAALPAGSLHSGRDRLDVIYANRITSAPGGVGPGATHVVMGARSGPVRLGDFTIVLPNSRRRAPMLDVSGLTTVDATEAAQLVSDSREEVASLQQPIFYQDASHTLFIEPAVTETLVSEWAEWVETIPAPPPPPVVIVPWVPPPIIVPWPGDPVGPVINPVSILAPVLGVDWITSPNTGLQLGSSILGSTGSIGSQLSPTVAAGVSLVGSLGAFGSLIQGVIG